MAFSGIEASRIETLQRAALVANRTALGLALTNTTVQPDAPRGCSYRPTGSNFSLYAPLTPSVGTGPVQSLQDNWLLAPFAGVASKRNITTLLFQAQSSPRLIGANYTFGDETLTVLVDDQLPFDASGRLCGAIPSVNTQGVASVWGAFLEKTFAKLGDTVPAFRTQPGNTGYRGLRLGSPAIALSALSAPGSLQQLDCRNVTGEALAQVLGPQPFGTVLPNTTLLSTLGQTGGSLLLNYTNPFDPVNVHGNVLVSPWANQLWRLNDTSGSTSVAMAQVYNVLREDPGHNGTHAVLQSPWGYEPVITGENRAVVGSAKFAIAYNRLAAVCDGLIQG